jgi:NADH dehydrogenase
MQRTALITGAFSFSGRAIAQRLLERGVVVRTLTAHPERAGPLAQRIEAFPLRFDDPDELAKRFDGVDAFYNTYWVRFDSGDVTFEAAVRNSRRLFEAARRAGVRRVVHVSIANPSLDSPLPYYRGKARVESDLVACGLSHAILRPTVLFGEGGVLLNNIAWLLRRLPVFAIPGDGGYRLQPVHVDDLARLAVAQAERDDDVILDATGPETYRYVDLVRSLRAAVSSRALLVRVPPGVALLLGRVLGVLLRDVLITRDEISGLRDGLLVSHQPATGETRLSEWLRAHADTFGHEYLSELALHYRSGAPGR